MPKWRECVFCGRLFDADEDEQRFCTKSHARQYEQQQRLTPEDKRVKDLIRAIETEIRRWLKD